MKALGTEGAVLAKHREKRVPGGLRGLAKAPAHICFWSLFAPLLQEEPKAWTQMVRGGPRPPERQHP